MFRGMPGDQRPVGPNKLQPLFGPHLPYERPERRFTSLYIQAPVGYFEIILIDGMLQRTEVFHQLSQNPPALFDFPVGLGMFYP